LTIILIYEFIQMLQIKNRLLTKGLSRIKNIRGIRIPFVDLDYDQRGSIIVFTVLMLAAILAITLTLTRIFIPKIRAITEATDSVGAVYAADSALEWCLYNNREKSPILPQPIMANGATYQIYNDDSPSTCPGGETLNYRTVGIFRGVVRSFEVSE